MSKHDVTIEEAARACGVDPVQAHTIDVQAKAEAAALNDLTSEEVKMMQNFGLTALEFVVVRAEAEAQKPVSE